MAIGQETTKAQKVDISPFETFSLRVQLLDKGKQVASLVKTDLISASVQVVATGGETNLHNHPGDDAVWLVLAGRAKFYTDGDREVATLGPYDGLLIPRGARYWFKSAPAAEGDNLVILKVGAKDQNAKVTGRVDLSPRKVALSSEVGERPAREVKIREGQFFGRK